MVGFVQRHSLRVLHTHADLPCDFDEDILAAVDQCWFQRVPLIYIHVLTYQDVLQIYMEKMETNTIQYGILQSCFVKRQVPLPTRYPMTIFKGSSCAHPSTPPLLQKCLYTQAVICIPHHEVTERYTPWKGSMAIATPISLRLSWSRKQTNHHRKTGWWLAIAIDPFTVYKPSSASWNFGGKITSKKSFTIGPKTNLEGTLESSNGEGIQPFSPQFLLKLPRLFRS